MAKSIDKTVDFLLDNLRQKGIETVWDRYEQQQPQCGFGELGICCRNCYMGPCRIDPFGQGPRKGICGATAEIIVARNFGRMIAAGSAAHSDHGRDVAETLLMAAKNPGSGYSIKDTGKLKKVAETLGIKTANRSVTDIAIDVATKSLENFGRQNGEIPFIRLAPKKRQELWKKSGCHPAGN